VETSTIAEAIAGDPDALAAIVDDFMPTVLGAAYGLTGDWHDAGDVAQEVFATMVVRLGDLREPAALPGWLMSVTRNTARRHHRLEPEPSAEIAAAAVEDVVVARADARRVRLAVEALPPEQRLPIVLHYFAGHSLADIAELCDLPLSTVKKRMRVARARLREGIDDMSDIAAGVCPAPSADQSDIIRMYTAMRSGNLELVGRILDARPELVDVRENWTRADSFAHRLPWTRGGGTPLLRAVERGDEAMVRLLIARGADPNGACSCEGGESPLWVAVLQRERDIADCLLQHGADPNVTAFAGATALDVARMRGYDDIVATLERAGATSSHVSGFPTGDSVSAGTTGIKSIDLWCPMPERGLVHLTPGFGFGAVVLISELSLRACRAGHAVVWTGFVQAPTDLGDIHHALAEAALVDDVTLSMASPLAPPDERLAAFDRGMGLAADDAFLVVFAESGHLHAIDERLLALSARSGVTLVVAPLDGSVAPPRPAGSPYLASIVFDVDRARRHRWPAVGPESWSKVAPPDLAALAVSARESMDDDLDRYLCQPFYVAEPFTGTPGETVPLDELRGRISELLAT
jgi:RNA polymerase sigma-70 factor (ECF subfamily)